MLRTTPSVTVTIDGPVGVGKSTVAHKVAARLSFTLIDTGGIYRAIAFLALEQDIDWDDEAGLLGIVDSFSIAFAFSGEVNRVFCNSEDVTDRIRTNEIGEGATFISQIESVRLALLALQRKLAKRGGSVLEGRAAGTVVYPDAEVKIYLDAPLDVRAERRLSVLQKRVPETTLEDSRRHVEERDQYDSVLGSDAAASEGVLHLDTTHMDLDAVVEKIVGLAGQATMKKQREARNPG